MGKRRNRFAHALPDGRYAAFALAMLLPVASAQAQPAPADPAGRQSGELPYPDFPQVAPFPGAVTVDMPIERIVEVPAARAVLEKYLPGFTTRPGFSQFAPLTLRDVQARAQERFNDQTLARIARDFRTINP